MGGYGRDDDGTGWLPSLDLQTNCRYNGAKGQTQRMVVVLGEYGAVGDRDLSDMIIRAKVAGKNCGVCRRENLLQSEYRRREDVWIHQVPQVVVPRTWSQTGLEGTGMK